MSKKDIITLPHESLRQRSRRVRVVSDETLQLVNRMIESTLDWEANREHEVGVALAAVQINELQRVIIIRQDFNDKRNENFEVFIDPEIVKLEGDIVEEFEGCLSVKDAYGKVPRHSKVRVKALDIEGKEVRVRAEGFLARVFQHEIDHTNGKLFIDHIKDEPERLYKLSSKGDIEELTDEERKKFDSILW